MRGGGVKMMAMRATGGSQSVSESEGLELREAMRDQCAPRAILGLLTEADAAKGSSWKCMQSRLFACRTKLVAIKGRREDAC